MSGPALWIARVQGVILVGIALALIVLSIVDAKLDVGVALFISEIVLALLGAALLAWLPTRRRARTPILLLEIIAVGVSSQLFEDHRQWIAVLVGLPALVAVVGILVDAKRTAR